MKTLLLSTTTFWNCGDDFIRQGILNLFGLPDPDVRTVWWNTGYGATSAYANNLKVNLPLADYFVLAGGPEWIDRNEVVYRHCLKHGVPIALVGVGARGGLRSTGQRDLMRTVARSGLVEIALCRDETARDLLLELGVEHCDLIPDPAFFIEPIPNVNRTHFLCWRREFTWHDEMGPLDILKKPYPWLYAKVLRRRRIEASIERYNRAMLSVFDQLPEPKAVTVHDNREVRMAERLFGSERVFFSSDYLQMLAHYSSAKSYTGSRVHGAIASIVHGAGVRLIYSTPKARVITDSLKLLSKHVAGLEDHASVIYYRDGEPLPDLQPLEGFNKEDLARGIMLEKQRVRGLIQGSPELSRLLRIGAGQKPEQLERVKVSH